jgi:hypothetical protein
MPRDLVIPHIPEAGAPPGWTRNPFNPNDIIIFVQNYDGPFG